MDRALYGPDGFYERGGAAGRRGDFLTSPEVGPLFAAVLARAVAAWCEPPRRLFDVGAGRGTLGRQLHGLCPDVELVLVEWSAALRAEHAAIAVTSVPALPPGPLRGVIFGNELLDNLPFDLFERRNGSWYEVRVSDGVEQLATASEEDAAALERLAPAAPDGGRAPLQRDAAAFVADVLRRLEAGRLVLVDYAATTAELASRPWHHWLRTYRAHERGGPPIERPGTQDITVEVAVDQLPPPAVDRSQAEFLRAHGIDQLVREARATWQERAHLGDLEALKARSRVQEADALLDEDGLGAFRVLEWAPRPRSLEV